MVDTVLIADGSPGPYRLGRFFIDTATIMVTRSDSGSVTRYMYISSVNGLLFSDPIDSGVALRVRFETDYYGLEKVYSFYEKRYGNPADTMAGGKVSPGRPPPSLQRENLMVSGYKTIGVSIGSFGQVNLEQGLDVRIGGEIRPGTEISAHLNDQGTSLEGTTREISEFDMIYIALTDPRFGVVAGDQYVEWPFAGILEGRKKIKGITASVSPKLGTLRAFGALAGGNFTVQTWRGEGGQGPYTLTGKGESGFITPIGGTIKVTVNGRHYEEGEENAYIVDYDAGTLTFTPRLPVRPEDLIRVEYEYKLFDYQRIFTGGSAATTIGDSALSVQGVFWSEIDNKNNPIELVLSDTALDSLRTAGNKTPLASTAQWVNPFDVPKYDKERPLYIRDSSGVFIHRRYQNRISNADTFYNVWFHDIAELGIDSGDYIQLPDMEYPLDRIYQYAGRGKGRYMPLAPLRAPQRLSSGELRTDLKLPLVKATVDVAGQERDKNLFSSRDDNDNLASAANAAVLVGNKRYDARSFWLGGNWKYWSKRFDREALSAFDRKSSWNDYSLDEDRTERQLWESSAGATPLEGLSTELSYGQQRNGSRPVTDKFGNTTRFYPLSWLHLDYNGTYFRHFEEKGQGNGHRQEGAATLLFRKHTGKISCRDEWRTDAGGHGAGLLEGALRYEFLPLHLAQEFIYTEFRQGNKGLLAAPDTGIAFLWQQALDCQPLPWWKVNGISTWQKRRSSGPAGRRTATTLLIDVKSETGSSWDAFSSNQHYRTTAERATRFIQVPRYVGASNKGTHRFDTTLNEYVEAINGGGDYIIEQRDVFDSTNSLRMRKTNLSVNWSLRRPEKKVAGILADLSWEGMLSLEEHIDAEVVQPSSWFPGYLSLRNLSKEVIPPGRIHYCDLSYRQEIDWDPSFSRALNGRLTITPAYRRIRSYREPGLTSTLAIGHDRKKLTLENEARYFTLFHDDTSRTNAAADFYLRDISVRFSQTRHIGRLFDISLRERLGWARQDSVNERKLSKPLDSTTYIQITPGAAWRIGERGRVEAEYTFSLVNMPPEHDYRIAGGFASGISHLINVNGNVKIGKYFLLNVSYRGEIFSRGDDESAQPDQHAMSVEVQAFL
ncbi:MAG: hypothetical protein JW913_20975 [Chitinispirillaceae bacterium]|nr:hypothetical protein [Chitinispirillaceae bacterium]